VTAAFAPAEYAHRLQRLRAAMDAARLDAVFLSSPEALCWLSGFEAAWYQGQSPSVFAPSSGIAVHVDRDDWVHFVGADEEALARAAVAERCAAMAAGVELVASLLRPGLPVAALLDAVGEHYRAAGMLADAWWIGGYMQCAAASAAPPALRAIVPRVASGVLDGVGFSQGPFALTAPVGWLAFAWLGQELHDGELDWSHRPLIDVIEASCGTRSTTLDALLARGFPWAWTTFPGVVHRERIRIPVLHWAGWWDNLKRGSLRHYRAMLHEAGTGPHHLIVDSTDHEMTKLCDAGPPLPELIAAGDEAAVAAFWARELQPALEFLDLHVRGIGAAPPLVHWHHGHVGWREADRWPPPGARELALFLGDGALRAEPPAAGSVRWEHDPANLVPDLTPDPSGYNQLLLPVDETPVQSRPDVLTFTREPSRDPLDLAGPVTAEVRIDSTHATTQLVVKLVDVDSDGATLLLAEGARMVRAHRYDGLVRVDLGDVGYRLRPGHRLALELASSRFPRYLPHPGTDEDPWRATEGRVTRQTLRTGGAHPSRLTLSVIRTRDAT
jgi:putative CocE/NonD family hydrolase